MRCIIYLVVSFVVIFCLHDISFCSEEWELVHGIKELDIKEIAIDTYRKGIIYVATLKAIYRSEDEGDTWEAVFSARGDAGNINFIAVSQEAVYVCTEKGLFKSEDGRSSWKKIFSGVGEKESTLHVAFSENGTIYLGTRGGLFLSSDNGLSWEKDSKEAGNLIVKWITFLEEDVFLVAEKGVYKSSDSGWERIFITPTEEVEYDAEVEDAAIKAIKPVNSLLVNEGDLFLASDFGIFLSKDKGGVWDRFISDGLLSLKVNRLLFKDTLFAATERGIFIFSNDDKSWKSLYKGMDTDKTQSISVDTSGGIWVTTKKGLYKSRDVVTSFVKAYCSKDVLREFSHEPSIREVQRASIEYADVHPEKIQSWRTRAKVKALLPELSVDYDKTVYTYGGDFLIGPYDWGVNFKWDLADLVWNPSQTSIDVRSRLMVQLRDDILDEITRTYFERRRLQVEMHLLPSSNAGGKVERELRMQELTADLDALTGGYFSAQLDK